MADFEQILGNDIVKNHFKSAIKNNKVSHAYILEGERGCGKKMLAESFARLLQCENPGEHACGTCTSCIQIEHRDHPDVIWVTHDKPNVVSVSDIREQLVNTVDIKPYKGPYKVYIIDEAEKMNMAAQNALLKTIEEPPEYAVILLLTGNRGMFLPTILSRCIFLSVKPVPFLTVKKYLKDRFPISDQEADFYARYSMGNIGKSVRIYESEDFRRVRNLLISILRDLHRMTVTQIYPLLKDLKKEKEYFQDVFDIMTMWYHDILIIKAEALENAIIFTEEYAALKRQSRNLRYEEIEDAISRIREARLQIRANVNVDAVIESLFFDLIK